MSDFCENLKFSILSEMIIWFSRKFEIFAKNSISFAKISDFLENIGFLQKSEIFVKILDFHETPRMSPKSEIGAKPTNPNSQTLIIRGAIIYTSPHRGFQFYPTYAVPRLHIQVTLTSFARGCTEGWAPTQGAFSALGQASASSCNALKRKKLIFWRLAFRKNFSRSFDTLESSRKFSKAVLEGSQWSRKFSTSFWRSFLKKLVWRRLVLFAFEMHKWLRPVCFWAPPSTQCRNPFWNSNESN